MLNILLKFSLHFYFTLYKANFSLMTVRSHVPQVQVQAMPQTITEPNWLGFLLFRILHIHYRTLGCPNAFYRDICEVLDFPIFCILSEPSAACCFLHFVLCLQILPLDLYIPLILSFLQIEKYGENVQSWSSV